MNGFQLDPELIDAFSNGSLDQQGEDLLARQVAHVLPAHWSLPNPIAAALSRLVAHLGGDAALITWLGRHPGLPRLVSTVYTLIGLLDRLSDQPAVVAALPEVRQQVGLPASLQAHLVPDPQAPGAGSETLASLGGQIELMLAEERYTEAVQLATATVDLLQQVLSRAAHVDTDLADGGRELEPIRDGLEKTLTEQ
jgi:hypothetical protein